MRCEKKVPLHPCNGRLHCCRPVGVCHVVRFGGGFVFRTDASAAASQSAVNELKDKLEASMKKRPS